MAENPLATDLNEILKANAPHVLQMLSRTGRRLYYPKGILTQGAEARQKAYDRFNATIGIATEDLHTMHLPAAMEPITGLRVSDALTYAPAFGIPELRRVWKTALVEKNPSLNGKTISLPVVTNGITHGIELFADLFVDPEDVLVFPDQMWGNYILLLTVRKEAEIVRYPFFSENGAFNTTAFAETVEKAARSRAKIGVVLNFPNNPTGYTPTAAEADEICRTLAAVADTGTRIMVVCDDAYFGLNYTENPMKESIFAKLADLHPGILAVKLDGATKELFGWGLRVGFITYAACLPEQSNKTAVYEALEKKTAGCIRGSVSSCGRLSQSVVLHILKSPDVKKQRDEKVSLLKARAERVQQAASRSEYRDLWDVYPFNSGYFMCIRVKHVDAERLRKHLLETYKVGLIAVNQTDLRVAFSCVDAENIEALFEYIAKGIQDLTTTSTGDD
jgi:aspartate/methionine/tyrosine aminotransferase